MKLIPWEKSVNSGPNETSLTGIAERYEQDCQRAEYQAPTTMIDMLAQYISIYPKILDVGAGTGFVKRELGSKFANVDGIDNNNDMLKKAFGRGYRNLICVDVTKPFFTGDNYDVLISVGLFGDFIDAKHLQHGIDLLNTQAIIGVAGRSENMHNLDEVLSNNSFKIIEQDRDFAYNQIVTTAKYPVKYLYTVAVR